MKLILAKNAGFCKGVRRGIGLAENALRVNPRVYTLGPLIHNPQEVERLASLGIIPVTEIGQATDGPLVIRSHGAGPEVFKALKLAKQEFIDATCPLVKKVQLLAKDLTEKGHKLVILGNPDHPEVKGIYEWAGPDALIINSLEQAKGLDFYQNLAVVSQTTLNKRLFEEITGFLGEKTDRLTVHNTICNAVWERQEEVSALAGEVDVMLVIGGKNSSNTKMLADVCGSSGVPAYHMETADDIDYRILIGKEKVGIAAGASTPDWIIEEVYGKMSEFEVREDSQELQNEEQSNLDATPVTEDSATVVIEERPVAAVEEEQLVTAVEEEQPVAAVIEDQPATAVEEEQSFADAYNIKEVRRGARVKGIVVQVKNDELLVDIGGKSEGVLPANELIPDDAENIKERFAVGDEIEVLILKRENQEGYPVLSKKRIDQELAWEKLSKMQEDGQLVTGKVVEVVKGGLLVNVGIRGFIPASLVALGYVENLSEYIGKEMTLKIIDCDREKNKLVLSAKAVLKEEASKKKTETLATIEEGQTKRGVVCRLTSFGAFVDIGGVDGLLHVSEMAWHRVNVPSDILKVGDELDVYILSVDKENEKISLGLKQLIPNPWTLAKDKYAEGSVITAKVVRTAPFGAFLEVEPGVEGLVHISQLAHYRVEKTEDVVSPGEMVEVKVLSVDSDAKRISLSIKAATEPPAADHDDAPPQVMEFTAESNPAAEMESPEDAEAETGIAAEEALDAPLETEE